ncbi:CAP domain-containing protein [Lophiotrema nucula]|uniref:CAP domain-containing protein n=1 Tax=Lophiotrema nucula TaxID=690887 RepID=A0A6A5YSN6_9PLEO|nr:CAP domain-containing protein [Lophiotrema nucula]
MLSNYIVAFLSFSRLVSATTASHVLFVERQDQQASVEYTDDDDFRAAVLNSTNTYRRQHNATGLSWNDTLSDYALNWSDRCVFEHSGGPSGENLASGYPNTTASHEAWGNERDQYDFKNGGFTHETGHFTQLVWKSSLTVGCGRTECNSESSHTDDDSKKAPGWYVVCEYYPSGNIIGEVDGIENYYFKQNVQARIAPEDEPTATANPTPSSTSGPSSSGSARPSATGNCPYPGQQCGAAGSIRENLGRGLLVWVAGIIAVVGPST